MRFVRKLMIGLAALAAVPLMAQGPVPAPTVKKAEAPALPAVKAPAAPVALDRADLEAWLDGYLPYALERGRIPGAVEIESVTASSASPENFITPRARSKRRPARLKSPRTRRASPYKSGLARSPASLRSSDHSASSPRVRV